MILLVIFSLTYLTHFDVAAFVADTTQGFTIDPQAGIFVGNYYAK